MEYSKEKIRESIRELLKHKVSDNQRFLIVCIVCGFLCGVAAVALHCSIKFIFETLWAWASSMSTPWFIVTMLGAPTFAGLLMGLVGFRFAPEAIGSGIPQTKQAYYNNGGKIKTRSGVWRFFLTSIYCGLGNSLGREGPTVHLSSAIASRLGHMAFKKPERIQNVTPVGMAAGIAAAFNAPLSAITFVFEELLDNFSMKSLGGIVIAVVTAAAVSRTLLGEDPILSSHFDLQFETSSWMLVTIPIGFAAGILGHFFVISVLGLRRYFNARSKKLQMFNPAVGGLTCGILGMGAYYITGLTGPPKNSVFSIGYDTIGNAFEASLAIQVVAVLLIFKFIAVVMNYATGGSGGLFSPTLFIGGMLGSLLGFAAVFINDHFLNLPDFPGDAKVIGGCVLLGMGAMFSAVIRCPFTSLIIIFEITGNYSLILPLMGCNVLAWSLGRKWHPIPLYDSLILQDGVNLKTFPTYQGAKDYRNLPVSAIMTYDPVVLSAEETVAASMAFIQKGHHHYHGYPVVNLNQEMLGLVTHHELENADPGVAIHVLVEKQKVVSVLPNTSIRDTAMLMVKHDIQQLPVVSPHQNKKLLGLITINDIARQQNMLD